MEDAENQQFQPKPEGEPRAKAAESEVVSWTASEFISHDKSAEWYLMLAIGGIILAFFLYLITKDFVTLGVVLAATVIFGVYASHKPRQLPYRVDSQGISIGNRRFSYNDFRSFSIMPEGAFSSVYLMPLKRFSPPTSIYYGPEEEEKVITIIAKHLPLEERKPDATDRLMRRVRF
jgi:hypothetical protein